MKLPYSEYSQQITAVFFIPTLKKQSPTKGLHFIL